MKKIIPSFALLLAACSALGQSQQPKVIVDKLSDAEYANLKNLQAAINKARSSLGIVEEEKRKYEIQLAKEHGADVNGASWMEWGKSPDPIEFKGKWIIITPAKVNNNMGGLGEIQLPGYITDDEQENQ